MNRRKLAVVIAIPVLLLAILYLADPNGFWHSPWLFLWIAVGGMPLVTYQSLWAPGLFRQMNSGIARPNRLLWMGLGFLFFAALWFLTSAALLTQYPAALGLSEGGNAMVMIAPCMLLTLVGLVLVFQRITIWYLD
jgi:hypothetical protein